MRFKHFMKGHPNASSVKTGLKNTLLRMIVEDQEQTKQKALDVRMRENHDIRRESTGIRLFRGPE